MLCKINICSSCCHYIAKCQDDYRETPVHVQILSLDYAPDVSMANIENLLQMLIINALEKSKDVS